MKTIIYSLIAIFLFGTIATGFTNKANTQNTILIQCNTKNVSPTQLSQSAGIISARLKNFSSGKSEVIIIPAKNQLKVMVSDSLDMRVVEKLLVQKGTIEFYETYTHEKLVELLKGNDHLFSIVKGSTVTNSDAKIGCVSVSETLKVNEYLSSLDLDKKCKFAWTQKSDGSSVCLFALKLTGEKGAIITSTYIESANYVNDRIQIRLKKSAVEIWSDATKRNMNNDIAIVFDNSVISYPKVKSVINSGEIEISGNFTLSEGRYIAVMLNNGELPVSFSVIK